ncbi:MAG: hypothetical protein HRU20_26760 [Pseudomonadales bacterium]|nr:hypothetical protein [Pseudomonadales bacterium]
MNSTLTQWLAVITVICIAVQINACVYSGQEDETDDSSANSTSTNMDSSSRKALIDPFNTLESTYKLAIDINLATQERAFLSICNNFSLADSNNTDSNTIGLEATSSLKMTYTVDFDACLVRAPLIHGQYVQELKVANHDDVFIVVVWYYDGSDPLYQIWRKDEESQYQQLVLD